jgi:hypothetical protein
VFLVQDNAAYHRAPEVSNLLNLGDLFLGERLNLHVIATTNAPVRELDGALTRPGRLIGSREFGHLAPAQARRLAEAKGLKLPDQPSWRRAAVLLVGRVSCPTPAPAAAPSEGVNVLFS